MNDDTMYELVQDMFESNTVRAGKMFGLPALYTGEKMFACVYEGGLGLKLPSERADAQRERPEVADFQPHGRNAGREWILITHEDAAGWREDADLIRESAAYVRGMSA